MMSILGVALREIGRAKEDIHIKRRISVLRNRSLKWSEIKTTEIFAELCYLHNRRF